MTSFAQPGTRWATDRSNRQGGKYVERPFDEEPKRVTWRMNTSRSQIGRLLDPKDGNVTLTTL
jgi:hypothetical protein